MATPGQVERLIEAQSRELARLQEGQAKAMLGAYDDARRELAERLAVLRQAGAANTFTGQQLRSALAQVEAGILQLEQRMGVALTAATAAARQRAIDDLVRAFDLAEPGFRDSERAVRAQHAVMMAERDALLLHQFSRKRYAADLLAKSQRALVQSSIQGETLSQAIDRLTSIKGSVFSANRYRAELVARMETARAYDASHQASMEATAQLLEQRDDDPDPLMKRADEYTDARNHPFSRALHGRVARITDPDGAPGRWRVPVSEVERHAAAMRKSSSGVLWGRQGAEYVGSQYPAHFGDRGRAVPWRRSWGTPHRGRLPGQPEPSRRIPSAPARARPEPQGAMPDHVARQLALREQRILRLGANRAPVMNVDGLTWQPARQASAEQVVLVDVRKLDRAWSETASYVGRNGAGGVGERYLRTREFAAHAPGVPLGMPRLSLADGAPEFRDGRHRWAVVRDVGHRAVPVTVQDADAPRVREAFGAGARLRARAVGD